MKKFRYASILFLFLSLSSAFASGIDCQIVGVHESRTLSYAPGTGDWVRLATRAARIGKLKALIQMSRGQGNSRTFALLSSDQSRWLLEMNSFEEGTLLKVEAGRPAYSALLTCRSY